MRGFIERYRKDILEAWRKAAPRIAAAQDLGPVALIDHIPDLLDQIADIADVFRAGRFDPPSFTTARRHALDRLADGFDVSAVVAELSLLRSCMLEIWDREGIAISITELRALDLAIDHAIAASVTRYQEARERTLAGIDRISTATLEATSLDELLRRLLGVFRETTPSVDTATILLLEDGRLWARANVGFDNDLDDQFSLAVGEGFAGKIAADRKPLHVRVACTDLLVRSEAMRRLGIRGLYGVPLLHEGRLIGVAHMGSKHASEFAPEDRQFFESLAARATVAIAHHVLRQELAVSEQRFKLLASERERALAKLESLLAAAPIGIAFLDRDLRYLRINSALAVLNGRTVADHIARDIREVLPNDAALLVPVLRGVIESGEPALNIEVSIPDPQTGAKTWLLANYFPVRNAANEVTGVGGIILDVTDVKRAQEALRAEQATLQSIMDHAPVAIWVKDSTGRIVIANQRLADATGTPLDTLVGRRSGEVSPRALAHEHQEQDERVMRENAAIEVEEHAPGPNGVKTFLVIKFPIPGKPPLVGGIAAEITDRKRMEQDLQAAVQMREDLLSVVSHDLRSPLSTVQLSATMLLGSQLSTDARARRHLEMIVRSCGRMESLIDDLLDMALLRAGRFTLELQREPIDDVVSEALELQLPLASEKGITLHRDWDIQDIVVACDRNRILQVFSNLIGNAIKFCRSGDTIRIAGRRAGPCVEFSVEDTGPGIAPEALRRLFEPYWSSPEHATKGSGLGLYIVRGIIESHGGRVWAESEVGKGARFVFTLPIAA